MKRLILMRHAKSDWSAGLDDHDRPLNARGIRSAEAMGDWLRRKGHRPDAVLCSSAARTRETLDQLDCDAPVHFERGLYLAAPQEMLALLQGAEGDTVLMLGHNPGTGILAGALVSAPPDHGRFRDYPTCATLVADFDIAGWADLQPGTGLVRDFAIPREILAE